MSEATFTFRVDEALKKEFATAAKARDRTGAQLLRDFMRDFVRQQQEAAEHDAWFREEVRQGLAEANDPALAWVPHEAVKEDMQRQREELRMRIAERTK